MAKRSYDEFKQVMKERKKDPNCTHDPRMTIDGVFLACCDGSYGAACKKKEITQLLHIIKFQALELDYLREANQRKDQVSNVTNVTNHTIINVLNVGKVMISGAQELVRRAAETKDLYGTAYKMLQESPKTTEIMQLLSLAEGDERSKDLFKEQVLGAVSAANVAVPDPQALNEYIETEKASLKRPRIEETD